ncbi:N-6 DNA methylase [Janthinobacterium sp. 78]|uniref:HsdM family class I SAM-dependent methyltransferase n=1 Tax=Janthinobacterium sp. 78 TaxID=2135631 RepID=UPI000D5F8BC0|nr:N-6 DNA methylase [Janthinobacterium sp. 78]PVX35266.1 type I restriction-modification system DNA methylase subunit [Janthinobacterium sp. 78]
MAKSEKEFEARKDTTGGGNKLKVLTNKKNENKNEKGTDQFVRDLLREIGETRPWEQEGGPEWKRKALAGGSKTKAGKGEGKPEFVFVVDGFIVIIEDKKETRFARFLKEGQVATDFPHRENYALNGALHYALVMLRNGAPHKKGIFAVGIGGDERHHEIAVAYVAPGQIKLLDDLDNLDVFGADAVSEYHSVAVLGNKPQAEVRLDTVKTAASKLHEGMRNYGSVENHRKAPLVSAILLALEKPGFDVDDLKGLYDEKLPDDWDGAKIYKAAHDYMISKGFGPQQKIGTLLDQFSFINQSIPLNRTRDDLGMSPLKWFTQILKTEVQKVVTDPSMVSFDVLGNFYHEFISYGGGDGNTLGIVLTPEHVTSLMVDLIDVRSGDWVLDPAAGTASFLIAAMHRMFKDAGDNETTRNDIRKNRLHGIELQDKLFAIGTTNMILRGDGKANFRRDSIFEAPMHEMRGDKFDDKGNLVLGHGFTKVLLNPPYSQAKDGTTRHLSELAFIEKALSFLNPGGRLAAIVPQSAMVGKTTEDKSRKASILSKHSLDAVITMNNATFADSGVSVHPVIALFTAGRAHSKDAKVKFINFQNDGYKVQKNRGLTDDGTASSRRKHLLEVLRGDTVDDTSFIVRSEITAADEWQHSYFYFNDQPPSVEDFMTTIADYLAWQVDMHAHGYGDLIDPAKSHSVANSSDDKAECA